MARSIIPERTRWLAILLSAWMAAGGSFPAGAQGAPTSLKIVILEGDGAINNIRQRTAREPIVQVQDENNRPVAGAVVIFTLPDRGASGTFANGARSVTVTTDAQGTARATGLRPNNVEGEMQIRVDVSLQGLTTSGVITQNNVLGGAAAAGAGGGSGKVIALLAILGGAAAGGIVAFTRSGDNGGTAGGPAPGVVTTVSAGTPTVGPPR
jgi:hypothetical protein